MYPIRSTGKGNLTYLFGVLGILMPFFGVYAAVHLPRGDLVAFNSTMIMILSILLLLFLLVNSFNNFFNRKMKLFAAGIVLLFLSMISFIWNLLIFITA